MAITTDKTITVHGVEVGISKPIQTLIANGDFTFAELSKFAIVGRHDFVNNVAGVFEPDAYSYMAGTSAAISELEKYPVLNSPTAPGWDSVLYTYFGEGNRHYDNYGKMVLVYNMISSNNTIARDFTDNNEACIVTEFNPRLIKMLGTIYTGNVVADVGDTGNYTIYDPEGSRSFAWMDDDTAAPFASLCIQNFDDAYYFDFPLYANIFNVQQNISGNRDSTYVSLQHIFDDYMQTGNKILSVWCSGGIDDFLVGANYGNSYVGVHNMSDERGDKILNIRYVPYGAECTVKASSLDTALKQLAGCGFYFEVDGTVYKPITEGGVVTGYTADLTKNSQWDLINDVTGNTIPDTPGGGGGSSQDDDPWSGVEFGGSSGGGGAFAKFYYMTSTELANLRSWMNSNSVPQGFDPMAQIIGLSQVPVAISGSAPENVEFVNSAAIYEEHQNRRVDSGVATQRGLGRTIIFNLGSVEIPRRMQQRGEPYLDYSCAIELYLPFCGIFSLDTQAVMGRTITAQLVLDPTSGSITGYAWVSQDGQKLPIAYGSGQAGVDLPVSAQQYGMSKAALSQANAQLSQSMLQGAMTLIQAIGGNATAMNSAYNSAASRSAKFNGTPAQQAQAGTNAARGAMSMPSDYVQYNASNNVMSGFMNWGRALKEISYGNNTAISGSFGGSYASWSNPFTAYVKIIRPKFQKPSNYNHTQAVPCVEARTVGSCSGLIQCIGVDASGITNATSGERDMIVAALSNGVYAGR